MRHNHNPTLDDDGLDHAGKPVRVKRHAKERAGKRQPQGGKLYVQPSQRVRKRQEVRLRLVWNAASAAFDPHLNRRAVTGQKMPHPLSMAACAYRRELEKAIGA